MFQTKVVEKIKTQICLQKLFAENRTVYEIMWKNFVDPGMPQMPIWSMRIACRINKATHTQSKYVIIIVFPTATMVERTRLNVMSICKFPVL
jgi:hypothetical protein